MGKRAWRDGYGDMREFKVWVPEEDAMRLEILLFDSSTGKPAYGGISRVFSRALQEYFQSIAKKRGLMDLNEAQAAVMDLRSKVVAGTATKEEMRDLIAKLREGRMTVIGQKTSGAKTKTPAVPINLDDLMA